MMVSWCLPRLTMPIKATIETSVYPGNRLPRPGSGLAWSACRDPILGRGWSGDPCNRDNPKTPLHKTIESTIRRSRVPRQTERTRVTSHKPPATMPSSDYSHHFSIRNVPFGIASSNSHPKPQGVTRLENSVIFLHDCHTGGLFEGIDGLPLGIFSHDTLNEFAALPKNVQQQVRKAIQNACPDGKLDVSKLPQGSIADIHDVQMHMPVRVGDFAGTVFLPPHFHMALSDNHFSRLLLLPGARQERGSHHRQRRAAATGLFQLPHCVPGACQLRHCVGD